jgi:hypothetical protein
VDPGFVLLVVTGEAAFSRPLEVVEQRRRGWVGAVGEAGEVEAGEEVVPERGVDAHQRSPR